MVTKSGTLTLLLIAMAPQLARGQTQQWSDPPKTEQWSAPPKTEQWSAPPKTEQWSAPPKTQEAGPPPATERWSEAPPPAAPAPAPAASADAPATTEPEPAPPPAPVPAAPAVALARGDSVLVSWPGDGLSWPGTVDKVRRGEYFVKFAGAIAPTDQWVEASYVRPARAPQPRPAPTPAESLKVGSRVEVESKGTWYPATVLDAGSEQWKVHYDRYDSSWDEWLPASRIRPATGEAKKSPLQPLPTGRFTCQVFEENQLKPQGELVLEKNGTYRDLWNKKGGSWKFDRGTSEVRFTGVLKNGAKATYSPETRHGMLTFDWGGGVKRWCYR